MPQGQAQLFGGEGHGRTVLVDLVAGRYYPVFLGVEGSNYVFDQSWDVDPAYVWWPPGADEPANRRAAGSDPRPSRRPPRGVPGVTG